MCEAKKDMMIDQYYALIAIKLANEHYDYTKEFVKEEYKHFINNLELVEKYMVSTNDFAYC